MSTPTSSELARHIARVLADDRVRRHHNDLPVPTAEEERHIARAAAASLLGSRRPDVQSHGSFGGSFPADTIPQVDERRVIDEAIAMVLGLGRLESLLDDDEISDIHIRGSHPVWVKMRDGRRIQKAPVVDSDDELIELIKRMAARMGHREQRFDAATPELNLQLPDGSRVFAAMEVSKHPTMVIRRHRFEYSSLTQLVQLGMVEPRTASFLAAAVRARRNIVIAGGTGSGKTTLLRALINEIPREERIVTIEDAYELGIEHFEEAHPDHDALQSRPANTEGMGEITMSDLTKMALRMDPDRVIVGEVRGAEAFPMLLAMSQGNNGSMCTMHADSARSVFPKLVAYVSMASTGLPTETVNLMIAAAVHFVVHVELVHSRRSVTSIHEVVDADGVNISSNEIYSRGGTNPPFAALRVASAEALSPYGFSSTRELAWSC